VPLTCSMTKARLSIRWKRLIWDIFILLYASLFFYNCLSPFPNWVVPYCYTMILIVWLGIEYYERHLFFQSGYVPIELLNSLLRAGFALFFYSSFVIGIISVVKWHNFGFGPYPFVNFLGVGLMGYSIYLRRKAFSNTEPIEKQVLKFYLSIALLLISIGLGYGSYFLIGFGILAGFPLIYLQYRFEQKKISSLKDFIRQKELRNINKKDYAELWSRYIHQHLKQGGDR